MNAITSPSFAYPANKRPGPRERAWLKRNPDIAWARMLLVTFGVPDRQVCGLLRAMNPGTGDCRVTCFQRARQRYGWRELAALPATPPPPEKKDPVQAMLDHQESLTAALLGHCQTAIADPEAPRATDLASLARALHQVFETQWEIAAMKQEISHEHLQPTLVIEDSQDGSAAY